MIRRRSNKEVRRFDIFKLTILLILLIMVFLLLLAEENTPQAADPADIGEHSETDFGYPSSSDDAAAESGYPYVETLAGEPGSGEKVYPADEFARASEAASTESAYPAPSTEMTQVPVRPTVSLPEDDVFAGVVLLRGTGQPGTQVQLFANGDVIGTTEVDANGEYSVTADLPAGRYEIDVAALDATGKLVERIPALLLPVFAPARQDITTIVASNDDLAMLTAALEETGLGNQIHESSEPQTLFAPTDSAFSKLPVEILLAWEAKPDAFGNIIRHLLLAGSFTQEELVEAGSATAFDGTPIKFSFDGTLYYIDGVPISDSIPASNGMIHKIERIVWPPLAPQVQTPIINSADVSSDEGNNLTITGKAEPETRILLQINGRNFGKVATVDDDGTWMVSGNAESDAKDVREIIAFMIDQSGMLMAMSQTIRR